MTVLRIKSRAAKVQRTVSDPEGSSTNLYSFGCHEVALFESKYRGPRIGVSQGSVYGTDKFNWSLLNIC